MNRAIVLCRPDPDENDLKETATAIVEMMGVTGGGHERVLLAVSTAYFNFKKPAPRFVADVQRAMAERGIQERDDASQLAKAITAT